MLQYWYVLPVGVLISTVVSAVGIGGGILWMPFFLIVLGLSAETAILTSLVIQTAGMGSASLSFLQQRSIHFPLALLLLIIALPSIALGTFLSSLLNAAYIQLILGVLVMLTAFFFVSSSQKYGESGKTSIALQEVYPWSWLVMLASIGSGMLSTSMNEWLIPVLRSRLGLCMSTAIATCVLVTFGICTFATIMHIYVGHSVSWDIALWGIPGVLLGGQIGSRITRKINERLLKDIFVFLLTLVGVHLVYNAW